MKCPVCQQEMSIWKVDMSRNPKTGMQYDRTVYRCVQDDTWARTEIPKRRMLVPDGDMAR
jgi:hypothetical protein